MKKLIPLSLLLFCCRPAHGQATYPAANCTTAAIQAAITAENASPANGDIISIPACSNTFTTVPATITTSVNLTIQGQTAISGNCAAPPTFNTACTATDNTLLTDGRTSSNLAPFFAISMTGSASQVVRVTGMSFVFSTAAFVNNGEIKINAGTTGQQARIDHNDFNSTAANQSAAVFIFGAYGVADHNVFNAGGVNNGVSVNSGGDGSIPWNTATPRGTANNFFFENNTFLNGYADDCKKGGTYVSRYNVVIATSNNAAVAQSHATGSDPSGSPNPQGRGCRAWEVYNNYLASSNANGSFAASFNTSGTGLQWGNDVNNYNDDVALVEDRDNDSSYVQGAPPGGWGYCGSSFNGTASGWDGNSPSSVAGYPCLDQIGRGHGDLLTGVLGAVCDSALGCSLFTGQWPNQALEPIYIWMETTSLTPGGHVVTVTSANGNIVANQDYYAPNASFNGTSGTGYGLLSARPSTCSAGPSVKIPSGGKLPGVAYWATDTNTLYVCYPANTWTPYYTPFTYPHPLIAGQTSGTPLAPTNLAASVN
jgi:hypothetical protein